MVYLKQQFDSLESRVSNLESVSPKGCLDVLLKKLSNDDMMKIEQNWISRELIIEIHTDGIYHIHEPPSCYEIDLHVFNLDR
uniref:Uncharacterized protein n=1 Tax=Lactuca sativa TaxID=4236 RepID=A0A9R1WHP0_LACSA|nr:hypothetical protein LSAT_V11C200063410 [Lactuca sativa]